jgi:hypothetical protein
MSTSGHHSQLLSRSNNNQQPSRNNFIPRSRYHTFRRKLQLSRLSPRPQPHLNSFHLRSLSLRRRRSHLHQLAGNVIDSRPFRLYQKKKKMNRVERTVLVLPTYRRHPPASADSDTTDDFNTPPSSPRKAERGGGSRGEEISSALRRLAISADADSQQRKNKIPPDTRGEGAAKVAGSPKLFQHSLAEAGPPSQRTRQMEKDLEKTLLKRYEEAKTLEKKKKKEKAIKKEQP